MSDVLAGGHHFDTKKLTFIGVLVSLGIVFGDIGTSPLYVMSAIIKSGKEAKMISEEYIEGIKILIKPNLLMHYPHFLFFHLS